MKFPDEFVFGVAASAYQIEGAWNEDGKGESIWDRFAHIPGKIKNGANGDVACDFYHRYKDDVALMKQLGVQAYRFSVSWSRVLPGGRGPVNEKGLDFYKRLVDELLAAGIDPWVNLYHWELPQVLQDRGGWINRDCAGWFADFACLVADRLADRVTHWMTMNEPMVAAMLGYGFGWHAPGCRTPWNFFKVIHHMLLGHGLAARAIRTEAPRGKIGIALDLRPICPWSDRDRDRAAAQKADIWMRRIILDPILRGTYPALFARQNKLLHPPIQAGDLETISTPIDYIGINTYSVDRIRYLPGIGFLGVGGKPADREYVKGGAEYTTMGWEVYPRSLYEVLMMIKQDYGNPLTFVTENGASFADTVVAGRVHDEKRIAYYQAHLAGVEQALAEGANCKGYFIWTFLDNFEWAEGYGKRFGLVYVDHRTQQRIVKDSGLWFREFMAEQKRCKE